FLQPHLPTLGAGLGAGAGDGDAAGEGEDEGFGPEEGRGVGRAVVGLVGAASSSSVPVEGGLASAVGSSSVLAVGTGSGAAAVGAGVASVAGAGGAISGASSLPPNWKISATATMAAKRKPPMMSPVLLPFCAWGLMEGPAPIAKG